MPRTKEITLKITDRQAVTLHAALKGLLSRDTGSQKSQRDMDRILVRLAKAAGWNYRPAFETGTQIVQGRPIRLRLD